MIGDKIAVVLQDLQKLKGDLKELKKSMRDEEKIDTPEYVELKRSHKGLKDQMKEMEENWQADLKQDQTYNELREMKVKKEEEFAQKLEKFFEMVDQLPRQPWQKSLETEDGFLKIQIQPEMRVYLNGKEEKKR